MRHLKTVLVAAVLVVGLSPVGSAGPRPGATPSPNADGAQASTEFDAVPAPPAPPRRAPIERIVPAVPAPVSDSATSSSLTLAASAQPLSAATVTGAGLPSTPSDTSALILYDTTGPYGWLGEVYATMTANLTSRFGTWTAHPVAEYVADEMAGYTTVFYIGSTYDEPLPLSFLDDVLAGQTPVVWMYDNIWQLSARAGDFGGRYGYQWWYFDTSPVAEVRYQGVSLERNTLNQGGIMDYVIHDPAKVTVIGEAVRADGTTLPWGLRSGNLTYLGEVPLSYIAHDDRYLAFADLLFDYLAPQTPQRHQALVRIEDVGPDADPAELRAVARYLSRQNVPFTVAVYPRYRDPNGADNDGEPVDLTLADVPAVVDALRYMRSRGGTLIMHGYTHQYRSELNPYSGVSADDFEFFTSHIDADDYVRYDGPVPEDSAALVSGRIDASFAEFAAAGLPTPTIFEFPHYAGSDIDYEVVDSRFGVRYDRGLYFPGVLSGAPADHDRLFGQFFPYPVRDAYGSLLVPENLGNVELEEVNHHPPRFPADLLDTASRNTVIRDGYASFFYHPYLGTSYLRTVVAGLKRMGYTFVSAESVLAG